MNTKLYSVYSYNSSYPLALIIEQENEYVMKNLTK